VRGLIADPERRHRMGQSARTEMRALAGALARTLDLADQVLAGRRG
jgi:3-deoxy-D-manno-octulosonic-acid transferase